MAADILLYDADEVPVGDDQRQHVEVARDWAGRFNSYFGDAFVVPRVVTPPAAARIMDLQRPTTKMSKSAQSSEGTLFLSDPPEVIQSKIRRAVTDTGRDVRRAQDKPGITNLLDIFAAVTDESLVSAEARFESATYASFKGEVADAVIAALEPIRRQTATYLDDRTEISQILAQGAEKARVSAEATCARVRHALGMAVLN